jgi:phosphoserine aminotransferase
VRVFNFSAGPAVLPEEVLTQAQDEMLDWHGSGMSVMELSHRGPQFANIVARAEADLRELLAIPQSYRVLFMQGGALAENAIVPLNLLRGRTVADYVDTGSWSQKSIREAQRYCEARVIASSAASGYTHIPPQDEWQMSAAAAYLHLCTNETIGGLEYHWLPELEGGVPLVADMSSHLLSRPVPIERFGLIYAGAQKNIGPSGLTLVIVREDLLGGAHPLCPSAFDYQVVADHGSLFNTPPTYAIYIAGLVFEWLKRQALPGRTPLQTMEARNIEKSELLYGTLDASGWYRTVVEKADRSRMNVPFFLGDDALDGVFLKGAEERGLVQLRGHKSVGGRRASIYNAMPRAGVVALVDYLTEFERQYG